MSAVAGAPCPVVKEKITAVNPLTTAAIVQFSVMVGEVRAE